jgi:hypothetical protein
MKKWIKLMLISQLLFLCLIASNINAGIVDDAVMQMLISKGKDSPSGCGSSSCSETKPLPNLRIWSVGLFDKDGHELNEQNSWLVPGEIYEIRVYVISKDENCENGVDSDVQNVETDIYMRISLDTDDGRRIFLKRVYTRPSTLKEGDPHKESFFFTVPDEAAGYRLHIDAKVDSTKEVKESNEGDNWSDTDKEWYPVKGSPDLAAVAVRLTNGRTTLVEGERYGLEMDIKSQGQTPHPLDFRSSYGEMGPNDLSWKIVATDGTDAKETVPGNIKTEKTLNEPFIAKDPGVHQLMACDDYNNTVEETDETNNCVTSTFLVVPREVDIIVSQVGINEGSTIIAGRYFHPRAFFQNIGIHPPLTDSRGSYSFSGPGTNGIWKRCADDGMSASDLAPQRLQYEEVYSDMCQAPTMTGQYILRVCADYLNQIPETNENNNCTGFPFNVVPKGVDFIISTMGIKEPTIKAGQVIHPWMKVRNIGNVTPSTGIRSDYKIFDSVLNTWKRCADDGSDASQLTPGRDQFEEVLSDMCFAPKTPGQHVFEVCADYQNQVAELNETNNCSRFTFTVIQ